MSSTVEVLAGIAGLGSAVLAGVFLTFSDFVMRSLHRADPSTGIEVMQIINREVYRSLFMVLFVTLAIVSLGVIGFAWLRLSVTKATLITAGAAIYSSGVFGVTAAMNVPMNKRLDRMDPDSAETASYWSTTYLPRWTRWNSVRTGACFTATACWWLAAVFDR